MRSNLDLPLYSLAIYGKLYDQQLYRSPAIECNFNRKLDDFMQNLKFKQNTKRDYNTDDNDGKSAS